MPREIPHYFDGPGAPSLYDQGMDRLSESGAPAEARAEADRVAPMPASEEEPGSATWYERWEDALHEAAVRAAEREPKRGPSERSDRIHVITDRGLPRWTVIRRDGYPVEETLVDGQSTARWGLHGDLLSVDVWGHTPEEAAERLCALARQLACPDLALAAGWVMAGESALLLPDVRREPASAR